MRFKNILKKEVKPIVERNTQKYGLTFHNFNHIKTVTKGSIKLGRKKGLNKRKLKLLEIASIFHDVIADKKVKLIKTSETLDKIKTNGNTHEEKSADVAEKILKNKNIVNNKEIKKIKKLILATKKSKKPKKIMEKIISDSDTQNSGYPFPKFLKESKKLWDEMGWSKLQGLKNTLSFIQDSEFHTDVAKKEWPHRKDNIKK